MDAEYQVDNNPAYNSILSSTRNGYTSTSEYENSVEQVDIQDAKYQVDDNPAYNITRTGYQASGIEYQNDAELIYNYAYNNPTRLQISS